MDRAVLVKLGGSLITDKRTPDTAREETLARLAEEVAAALPHLREGLVLGHGSGSFGHVAASRYDLHHGVSTPDQLPGIPLTQASARRLHELVLAALRGAGVLPFSVAPSSAAVAESGRPSSFAAEPVALALRLSLVPVVYGDVILDRRQGATIFSTETVFGELLATLPEHGFEVGRLLWLGETDGIYDARGETLGEIRPGRAEEALAAAGDSAGTDVTGGMAHRLRTALALARRGVSSWIGNGTVPGSLDRALRGEAAGGTWVLPDEAAERAARGL